MSFVLIISASGAEKYMFFTWLNSKHKLPSLQLLSDSFLKELDKHVFFTTKSACFLCF